MLSSSVSNCISIQYRLSIDAPHNFAIVAYATPPAVGSEITISKDGVLVLIGIVTKTTKNADGTCSISGQDRTSFNFSQETVHISRDADILTTLSACCVDVSSAITCSVSQSCYGYGSYSGTKSAFIDRICNSFGLHYIYNPIAIGITIYDTVIEPAISGTAVNATNADINSDYSRNIGTIRLQKSVTTSNSQTIDIKNGANSWSVNSPILNTIPAQSDSTYPRDVWIDPGTFQQVQLYSNSNFVEYSEPVSISASSKIVINSWSDTTSNPRFRLYIYDINNNLIGNILSPGEAGCWRDSSASAVKVVIARQLTGQTNLDYPNFDGLICNITIYNSESNNMPWQKKFSSGDGGREDTNVIDEPMFPDESTIPGVRIAKRDSNPRNLSISCPGHQSISLFGTYSADGFAGPAVDVTCSAAGSDTTTISGEW